MEKENKDGLFMIAESLVGSIFKVESLSESRIDVLIIMVDE